MFRIQTNNMSHTSTLVYHNTAFDEFMIMSEKLAIFFIYFGFALEI